MKNFNQLGLSQELLKVINEMGFKNPTDIQAESIPLLLKQDRDFIGLAQTGTGKTAAFGLPLLQQIDPSNKATQALILAPTRELGQQIAGQLETFSKYMDRVSVLAVYGGASITAQMKALRKAQHVIIATPGRLIDLIKRKSVDIQHLRFLVLDEADEMLNMGFKDELDKILSYTPKHKTTWLFSATMPKEMNSIVSRYMNDPVRVAVNSENTVNANIDHQYAMVNNSDKVEALVRFLNTHPDMRGLVFCRTRRGTQKLADQLAKRDYRTDALHGDMSQNQRDKVMNKFKKHELQILVATDVAARGIDVNDLTHVFHFSLPDDISYYTHRSGRTARAGKEGISISFVSGQDRHMLNRISKNLDIQFKKVEIPAASDVVDTRMETWAMDVLNTPYKGKLDDEVVDKVNMLFHNLTKEELISKLISHQMEGINISGSTDLNQPDVTPGKKHNKSKRRSGGKSNHRKGRKSRNRKGNKKGHYKMS